jgi:hypothetical protein
VTEPTQPNHVGGRLPAQPAANNATPAMTPAPEPAIDAAIKSPSPPINANRPPIATADPRRASRRSRKKVPSGKKVTSTAAQNSRRFLNRLEPGTL